MKGNLCTAGSRLRINHVHIMSLGLALILAIIISIIIFVYSPYAGGTEEEWSGEKQVTDADRYAGNPAAGIDAEDNTYLVWEEDSIGKRDIHFMKMSPMGDVLVNWSIARAVVLDSAWPDIAVESDGTCHIVWQDSLYRNIYYMEIDTNGEVLISPLPIVNDAWSTHTPSIAVDNSGLVHIVWLDLRLTSRGTDYEIYYTALDPSRAEGRSSEIEDEDIRLIDDTRISNNLVIIDITTILEFLTGYRVLESLPFPDVAIDSHGDVHVVWTDGRDGNPEIYYSLLDPSLAVLNGSSVNVSTISLISNSRLTLGTSISLQPMIAIGPDDSVHLAFTDNLTNSFEVYYGKINDGMIEDNFIEISRSDQAPSGLSPIFIDHQGNIYISWRDICHGHFEVFLSKMAPDGEIIWDNKRISHCESTAGSPPVVVDTNQNPIIFWQDNRSSVYQVYYNRTQMFPDLAIASQDIRTNGMIGTPSYLFVTVHNQGNMEASGKITVQASESEWTSDVNVAPSDDTTLIFGWTVHAGTHDVSVHLDPEDLLVELDENNNYIATELSVEYPPVIGIEKAELSFGGGSFTVFDGGEYSIPLDDPPSMLNLTIYNNGGYPAQGMSIRVEGRHEIETFAPDIYSTVTDLNGSSVEEISFSLDMIKGRWFFSILLDSDRTLKDAWKEVDRLNFTLDFQGAPDPSIQDLTAEGSRKDGKMVAITVFLRNRGEISSTGTLSILIDGSLYETRMVLVSPNSLLEEHFDWRAVEGDHSITAILDAEADSNPDNNSKEILITIEPSGDFRVKPIVIAGSSVVILAAALLLFTENGKYNFMKFMMIPFYTRLKRGKVLDHFMRGQVYGFIKANPGAHYNLIRRKLEINNGALAYHISVLEREKFIRSRKDGTLKRFYPSDMNVPTGHELTEMERRIIDVIRANPGFSQKEVALTLGLSPQVINYHIKSLARNHVLRLTRVGKRTLCYLNEDVEIDS